MSSIESTHLVSHQEQARRHLWMHFSRMGGYDADHEIPVIVRGEGCHVWDEHGRRYFDGLSALFCVNIGHGRADVAQAGADQAQELGFFTNWSYAHPPAIELATRIAAAGARRHQPRVLHQRRQRGGRVGDQARAPLPQAHRAPQQDQADRARGRLPRHQPGGAVRDRDHRAAPALRAVHARRLPRAQHEPVPAQARLRRRDAGRGGARADRVRGPRDGRRGDHGAGPERRRLLHAPRGLLPAHPRDLRRVRRPDDLRRGDLLVGAPGRVVRRPALRLPARHHHHG